MTVSARDVAAAIRDRLPGVGVKKLHKLLYYCQGHHLAHFGVPLFFESVAAFDMGPVVASLWSDEKYGTIIAPPTGMPIPDAGLNTIGYVVSRYARLNGRELEILTHSEMPWQRANEGRLPGTSSRIENDWIRDHFRTTEQVDLEEDPMMVDSDTVRSMLAGARERLSERLQHDDPEEIRARRREIVERLASA